MLNKSDLSQSINFQQSGKRVLQTEREGLDQLEPCINENFTRACEKILACSGKVIVTGIGKSGLIGCKMAATFASTGTPAFFLHPSEAIHGNLGVVESKDIVIAISNSGESDEVSKLITVLKLKKTLLICITSKAESTLGKAANIHLCIPALQEACPSGLAPTTSTTVMLVMGDALAVAVSQARGFTPENFALSHPGGALGRKLLLRVSDIMHTGDALPHVNREASLRHALLEMTHKKLGLTVICNQQMQIEGIFTDGDLRRVFDMQDVDLNHAKIADVMTRGGVRVRPDTLAVDALNLMQSRHITALLVAEGEQLLGVVHLHDILKAGVV